MTTISFNPNFKSFNHAQTSLPKVSFTGYDDGVSKIKPPLEKDDPDSTSLVLRGKNSVVLQESSGMPGVKKKSIFSDFFKIPNPLMDSAAGMPPLDDDTPKTKPAHPKK